jgi:copper homeostasis protein
MNQSVILEVCANSVISALAAQNGGAARVELCENLYEGGTTPSYGSILLARKLLHIQLYVLIRPRGGDFLYTDIEYNIITEDVKHCLEAGCDGIVIGILNPDGTVDRKRCEKLVRMAKQNGASTTFHRAFDRCNDQFKALEDIIEMGFDRILTSGERSTAMEGSRRIAELVKKADGRISIMPGSGINENNVTDLVHFTGVAEVHSSARLRVQSLMDYKNDHIITGNSYKDEYSTDVTDVGRVKEILKNANS